MANRQRRIKPELWIVVAFVALLAYALIADWWKDNPVLGRVIVGVVIGVLVLSLVFIPRFRQWLVGIVKRGSSGLVYRSEDQDEASERSERLPISSKRAPRRDLTQDERNLFIDVMGNVCENPNCGETRNLQVHHIEPWREGGKNKVWNLLVLCGNCHNDADKRVFPIARQKRWADRGRLQRLELRRSGRWKYG